MLREVVTRSGTSTKLLSHLSGNGFRLIYSVNEDPRQAADSLNKINSAYAQQLGSFLFPKPFIVNHILGNSAATMIHDQFQFITSHPYFVAHKKEKEETSGENQEDNEKRDDGPKEYTETGTDNPEEDFQIMHNSVPANVPPLPWIPKKVDMKPKIIVVEEMDLNDISEIFLLRSRLAFLETQKGIIREQPAEKESQETRQEQ